MIRKTNSSAKSHWTPLDRFNAFSDGVFAIIITILVLELPVPEGSTHLFDDLLHETGAFVGYFVSFAFIGAVWMEHARLTQVMKRGDNASYGLNLLLLMLVSLIPFSAKLMVSNLGVQGVGTAVLVYGLDLLLSSAALSALMIYVSREPDLLVDELADDKLKLLYRQRGWSLGINAVALFLAFVAPYVAVTLYFIQALLLLILPLFAFRSSKKRKLAEASNK